MTDFLKLQALCRTDICNELRMPFSCSKCDFTKYIIRAYVIVASVFISTHYAYSLLLYYFMSNYTKCKFDLMSVNWLYLNLYLMPHTSEKQFHYHLCNSTVVCIVNHYYLNTTEKLLLKPFDITLSVCTICDLEYRHWSNFENHIIQHYGENLHQGYVCTRKAIDMQISDINTQKAIYEIYDLLISTCTECDFKCGNCCYFKPHLILHTGENPFLCLMCHFKILVSKIIYYIYDSPYTEFLDDVFYIQYISFHCACSKFTGFCKISEYNSYIRWLLFWISHIMMNHKLKYLFYQEYSSSYCIHIKFIGSLKIRDDYNYYSRWLPFWMTRILFLTPGIWYFYFSPILLDTHIEQLSTNSLFHKHVRQP